MQRQLYTQDISSRQTHHNLQASATLNRRYVRRPTSYLTTPQGQLKTTLHALALFLNPLPTILNPPPTNLNLSLIKEWFKKPQITILLILHSSTKLLKKLQLKACFNLRFSTINASLY